MSDQIGIFNPIVIFLKSLCSVVVNSFFGEVNIIGEQRIPTFGPVIFFGNHGNQFVDACILMYSLPRYPRFLIAEVSFSAAVIGKLARWAGAIGVQRPTDKSFKGSGLVNITYVESVGTIEEETTFKYKVSGDDDTRLCIEIHTKDNITVEDNKFFVTEIVCDSEAFVECKKKVDDIANSSFMVIPKVDQSRVYGRVTEVLAEGGAVGIFPEGGSHDQTELLPLKPGIAIMALEAACKGVDDVLLAPVGIFYSSAKDFMSDVTIEVNRPIRVQDDLMELYKEDRHAAVNKLLQMCQDHLKEVMISAVDDEVLACVDLAAALYPPDLSRIDGETHHQMMHLFSCFFRKYSEDERAERLLVELHKYSCLLKNMSLTDPYVRYLRQTPEEALICFAETLPLTILSFLIVACTYIFWGPIRGFASYYATRKSRQALKKSTVKVRAVDVVASFKILLMIVIIPVINSLYGLGISLLIYGPDLVKMAQCILFAVTTFPIFYFVSIKELPRLQRMYRILVACLWPISKRLNSFRQDDKMLLENRRKMIITLRETVTNILHDDETLREELDTILPRSLIETDTSRLRRSHPSHIDTSLTGLFDYREEML